MNIAKETLVKVATTNIAMWIISAIAALILGLAYALVHYEIAHDVAISLIVIVLFVWTAWTVWYVSTHDPRGNRKAKS